MEPIEEQENILLNNCNFLDFIYNIQVITEEQYEIGLRIKEAFQKQKEFKTIITYEKRYINNRTNKQSDGNIANITEANRDYMNIERILTNKENKQLLEETVCLEHKTIVYLKQLNNDKNKFYDLILKICKIFDGLESCFCGSEYDWRIKRLSDNIL